MANIQSMTDQESEKNNRASYTTNATGVLSYMETELSHDDNQEEIERNLVDGNDAAKQTTDTDKPFYRRKRFWVICGGINVIILIILIPLIILVIFPSVAQKAINNSNLSFSYMALQMPIKNDSFSMSAVGEVTNGGSISGSVTFPEPVDIIWKDTKIGKVQLPDSQFSGGSAKINSTGIFNITNADAFGQFTIAQLSNDNFTWTLDGKVDVKALGITKRGLDFKKNIVIQGGAGFKNSSLIYYQFITYNNTPLGGQSVTASIWNPSPISIFLGTLGLDVYYKTTFLGLIESQNLTINPGQNTIDFVGGLAVNFTLRDSPNVAELFSRILSQEPVLTTSKGAFAKPDGVNEVTWLSTGIRSMEMDNLLPNVTLPPLLSLLNLTLLG
ncbi:9211_t:CDS:2 [Ambispora gerdemannii]|uniref:9211_t:CDS:1 n=1 Tax=Ambispora gerdemannii TaxID=144530 RepID=A0A9N9BA34_9GLOM|nr:9211_t:CDS:2 [Ambispora gerdemannii]